MSRKKVATRLIIFCTPQRGRERERYRHFNKITVVVFLYKRAPRITGVRNYLEHAKQLPQLGVRFSKAQHLLYTPIYVLQKRKNEKKKNCLK